MIRHITSYEVYEKILRTGYIKPGNRGRESCLVSFETYNNNDNFIELIRNGKGNFKNKKLIGIYINEDKLKADGFQVYYTDSSTYNTRINSKYTTKYENIVFYNGIETEEYKKIGEYVFVRGDIPISYIDRIEEY